MDAPTKALIEELKAQRNMAHDMLANAAAEIARLKFELEEAKKTPPPQ